MPYVTPVDHQDSDIPPLKLRRHQCSCSGNATFMDERGPGAFAPMPKLPHHKSQPPRAIFHFSKDDSDSSDELGSSSNMLDLTVDISNVLSNFPTGVLRRSCHSPLEGRRAPHVPGVRLHQHTQFEPVTLAGGP